MSETTPEKGKGKALGKGCLIAIGVIFGLGVLSAIFGDKDNAAPVPATTSEAGQAPDQAIADDTADNLTGPQRNAVRSAKQYIQMSGFSRNGLIDQLSSDAGSGYEVADATVAVDSLNIDWNEQAARSAKQYLDMSGFSCKGLIDQLSSSAGNKYTVDQATYGAKQAGAC